jgi:hypothetical protein
MAIQVERPWEFMAKGLDFGLAHWRLHTMPSQRLSYGHSLVSEDTNIHVYLLIFLFEYMDDGGLCFCTERILTLPSFHPHNQIY